MEIEEFDQHPKIAESVRHGSNEQRYARCPGHDDQTASLSYRPGDNGGIALNCKAGCPTGQVLASMGLSMADVMGKPYKAAEYAYTTAEGALLWVVERWHNPKKFLQRRPGPDGEWIWSAPLAGDKVLFNLPGLEVARTLGAPVYLVEGEKDVMTLDQAGVIATCNPGGAGDWLPQYTQMLRGLDVIVIADNDLPGRTHARTVARELAGVAKFVRVVHSPFGSDVSDLLDNGYTLDALVDLPEDEEGAIFTAAQIKTRKVTWAWPGYIPFGKVTIIEGDPGDGKSILTVDLAAKWSTGAPMPDGSGGGKPMVVIMVSAEDDMDDTIVPRLEAAGANTKLVKLVPHGAKADQPFDLSADMGWLEAAIVRYGARVVVFDPVTSFINERTDTHNDSSTRRALYPLRATASKTGCAILVVRHLNKGTGKALYRGGGSIGFIAAARAAYLVAKHPEEPNTRLFANVKMNLAKTPPTLSYEIRYNDDLAYIVWGDAPVELEAQSILDGPGPRKSEGDEEKATFEKIAREYEREFLLDLLSDGPMSWKDIAAAGKEAGFADRTLRRARVDARLVQEGKGPAARWAKPAEARTTESSEVSDRGHLGHSLEPHTGAPNIGHDGQDTQSDYTESPPPVPAELTDDDRDAALAAAPAICEICQTTKNVARFGKPYWVVRCFPHNPRTYHGGVR